MSQQKRQRSVFGEMAVTYALCWIWMLVITTVLHVVGVLGSVGSAAESVLMVTFPKQVLGNSVVASSLALTAFVAVVMAPLIEEILFRWTFCTFATDREGEMTHYGLGLVLAGPFILFGLAHGHGIVSILIQGVTGLLLARLWFRVRGAVRDPFGKVTRPWRSYLACAGVHGLYNLSILLAVVALH